MQGIELLRSIGYPRDGQFIKANPVENEELYRYARANKIGSLYVKSLAETGELHALQSYYENRRSFQERLKMTYENILTNFPNDMEYVIVKTAQSFWADSSDIDILSDYDLDRLKNELDKQGYFISGRAPTALSVRDPETDILLDIQSDFGLYRVKYHDKRTIQKEIRRVKGHKIPVTTPISDIALQIDHSITELIFILKEYYSAVVTLETSSKEDISNLLHLIKENASMFGARVFFSLIHNISKKVFGIKPAHMNYLQSQLGDVKFANIRLKELNYEFPYRYSKKTLVTYTFQKFNQQRFRNSFLRQLPYMLNPKIVYYLLKKVHDRGTRNSYIEETYDKY